MFVLYFLGVICSVSRDDERIAISFRSSKLPSQFGHVELVNIIIFFKIWNV